MKKKSLYLYYVVLFGFLIPIIPRVIVPLLFPIEIPGRHYRDTFSTLLREPLFTIGVCTWSAVPFIVLAVWIRANILNPRADLLERNKRVGGAIGAFILTFGVGILTNVPQTAGGVNLGMFLFPIYAIVAMPLGYVFGSVIAPLYFKIICHKHSR